MSIDRHDRPGIWIILLVLLIGSIPIKAQRLFTENIPLGGDEPEYVQLAHSLEAGDGFARADKRSTAWRTPGVPFYIAIVLRMTGDDIARARVVVLLVNCLIAPALAGLTWLLFRNRLAAAIAGLLWMADGNSHHLAVTLMGEEPAALLLVAASIVALLARRRRNVWLAGLAGALVGTAILIRGFLLLVILAIPIWYIVANRRAFSRLAAASLAVGVLVVGGWVLRNAVQVGTLALSTEGPEVVWIGNYEWTRGSWDGWSSKQIHDRSWPQTRYLQQRHPGVETLDEVSLARVFSGEAVRDILAHPRRVAWLLPRKVLICFSPTSYLGFNWAYAIALPLCVFAVVSLVRQHRVDAVWLLGLPALAVLFVSIVTFADPRFRHPVDPMIYALAGYGAVVALARVRGESSVPTHVPVG